MRIKRRPQDFLVSRLYTANQDNICDHFLRLNIRSCRARSCGAVNDDRISEYAQNIFRCDSIVCGAFVDGQFPGIVELRGIFHSWPTTTDSAFSVETDWQNIGIRDALLKRMFAVAQNRGIRTIQIMWLKENSRMRHFATKHYALLRNDQDTIEAVLHPHWPGKVWDWLRQFCKVENGNKESTLFANTNLDVKVRSARQGASDPREGLSPTETNKDLYS